MLLMYSVQYHVPFPTNKGVFHNFVMLYLLCRNKTKGRIKNEDSFQLGNQLLDITDERKFGINSILDMFLSLHPTLLDLLLL